MLKEDVRIQLVHPEEMKEGTLYIPMVSSKGPAVGIVQVLDEKDGLWYSVAIVATEKPRIISNEN